jgi:hypothetical protein
VVAGRVIRIAPAVSQQPGKRCDHSKQHSLHHWRWLSKLDHVAELAGKKRQLQEVWHSPTVNFTSVPCLLCCNRLTMSCAWGRDQCDDAPSSRPLIVWRDNGVRKRCIQWQGRRIYLCGLDLGWTGNRARSAVYPLVPWAWLLAWSVSYPGPSGSFR